MHARAGRRAEEERVEDGFLTTKSRGMHIVLFWMTAILVVVLDQATKAGVDKITDAGPTVLIPGILNLTYVENTGAAFSIGQGGGAFFVVVAVAFLIGSLYLVWKEKELPIQLVVSIGLVAGGGMGNMIDRVMQGFVTNFLSAAFIDFPVFNVADICVTVGIFVSVIGYWIWESQREREESRRVDSAPPDGLGHV
jgi:signal peptidase II